MESFLKENEGKGKESMIGIFTALLGALGFIGGNLNEQWQNDQARINSTRNPQNTTGTYMDFRGKMRDAKTNKPVILSGDGKGNILVKDTYGVTMRVCKPYHEPQPEKKSETEEVPYNLRNARRYTHSGYVDAWQCEDCGAWNEIYHDRNGNELWDSCYIKCRGCQSVRTENARIYYAKDHKVK